MDSIRTDIRNKLTEFAGKIHPALQEAKNISFFIIVPFSFVFLVAYIASYIDNNTSLFKDINNQQNQCYCSKTNNENAKCMIVMYFLSVFTYVFVSMIDMILCIIKKTKNE